MLPKFTETKAAFNMVQSWKNIRTPAELNRLRHDLDKKIVRVHADGSRTRQRVAKAARTPRAGEELRGRVQRQDVFGDGILAKLVANSWKIQNVRVMEFLADIPHGSMSPPINLYERSEEAGRNRRERYETRSFSEVFGGTLPFVPVATGTATLGEASKDPHSDLRDRICSASGSWICERNCGKEASFRSLSEAAELDSNGSCVSGGSDIVAARCILRGVAWRLPRFSGV